MQTLVMCVDVAKSGKAKTNDISMHENNICAVYEIKTMLDIWFLDLVFQRVCGSVESDLYLVYISILYFFTICSWRIFIRMHASKLLLPISCVSL